MSRAAWKGHPDSSLERKVYRINWNVVQHSLPEADALQKSPPNYFLQVSLLATAIVLNKQRRASAPPPPKREVSQSPGLIASILRVG